MQFAEPFDEPLRTVDFMKLCYLAGLDFEDDGDKLIVRPSELITDVMRFGIKLHKSVILRILKSEFAEGEPCKVCQWRGRTMDGYCENCIDLQVEAEARGMELKRIKYA